MIGISDVIAQQNGQKERKEKICTLIKKSESINQAIPEFAGLVSLLLLQPVQRLPIWPTGAAGQCSHTGTSWLLIGRTAAEILHYVGSNLQFIINQLINVQKMKLPAVRRT